MGGPHGRPLIGWHSHDVTLRPWLEAEAARRQVTRTQILDEALALYRDVRAHGDYWYRFLRELGRQEQKDNDERGNDLAGCSGSDCPPGR